MVEHGSLLLAVVKLVHHGCEDERGNDGAEGDVGAGGVGDELTVRDVQYHERHCSDEQEHEAHAFERLLVLCDVLREVCEVFAKLLDQRLFACGNQVLLLGEVG